MKTEEVLQLINADVRGLDKYHLKKQLANTKLNQNENPCDWDEEVKEIAASFCKSRPWNRYPSFIPERLKESLARYTGVAPKNIIAGNGSNEMLLILLLSFVNKSSSAVICTPTFTVYNLLVRGIGGDVKVVNLNEQLQYDVPAICSAVEVNPSAVLILCSPNNPTGSTLSKQQILAILEVHRGILILDQAYIEFGGYNAVELIDKYPNLIITRTFSKALGAAGLRVGYIIAAEQVIAEINKIKLPYNINFFSEYVATLILENRTKIDAGVEKTLAQRQEMFQYLSQLPFDNVYPTDANFILVRTPKKQQLFDYLVSNDILVRDVSSYDLLENCLRISIGTVEENSCLRTHLMNFFENQQSL